MIGEGIDVALRFGELHAPGMVAKRLGELQRLLVASPAYLAKHGVPRSPAELAKHAHIRYSGLNDGDTLTLIGPHGPEIVALRPTFRANNTLSLLTAIEAGLGIGGAQRPLIGEQLATGALVPVLPEYRYPPMALHAVYPALRFIPEKVRAWVAHLQQALTAIEGISGVNAPARRREHKPYLNSLPTMSPSSLLSCCTSPFGEAASATVGKNCAMVLEA